MGKMKNKDLDFVLDYMISGLDQTGAYSFWEIQKV